MRSGTKYLLQNALHQYEQEGAEERALEELYRCDLSVLPPELSVRFVQLQPDTETQVFITKSIQKAGNICLQFIYILVNVFLGLFLSQTAINGLLEKGKMFVFSQDQLKKLLSSVPPSMSTHSLVDVLDIGSGDGHVTEKLKIYLDVPVVHVTETSTVMQRVLRQKGFCVEDVDKWHQKGQMYNVISCLNVLDRCDRPLSMLKQITDNLHPGGILIIALVLPYQPLVETYSIQTHPTEQLPLSNSSWEENVSTLWKKVLQPLGYLPVAVSRVPYISEGDLNKNYYTLDDVIFVLKRIT